MALSGGHIGGLFDEKEKGDVEDRHRMQKTILHRAERDLLHIVPDFSS